MAYRIAGIDVHKKKLAVVVADVEVDDEYQFERRWFGSNPEQLQRLAEWLIEQRVEEVVMNPRPNTGNRCGPHWNGNRAVRIGKMPGKCRERSIWRKRCPTVDDGGAKKDFLDAQRLVKRLVSQELTLSFVPDTEHRLWKTLKRRRYQRTRDRVQNQLEALLEEAHIKLSSLVSDLLGASARRMLHALADGETDPARSGISFGVRKRIDTYVLQHDHGGAPLDNAEEDVVSGPLKRYVGDGRDKTTARRGHSFTMKNDATLENFWFSHMSFTGRLDRDNPDKTTSLRRRLADDHRNP